MALSSLFSVGVVGGAASTAVQAHSIPYGNSAEFIIQSLTGIKDIAWSIPGTSKSTQAAPSISLSGTPTGQKATVAMPSDPGDGIGRSFIMKLTVTSSGGESSTTYRVFGAGNASGRIPVAANEELYRNATHGWTDVFNDALNTIAGVAGSSGSIQYNNSGVMGGASGTFLGTAGLRFEFVETASSTMGLIVRNSTAATDTNRRVLAIIGQLATGNTDTRGGTAKLEAGAANGSGGTHRGGWAIVAGGSAPGGSGTRNGGDVSIYGGTGGTRFGNVYIGTDLDPDTYNWQGMGRGIAVQDCQAEPSADLSAAFAMWSQGGKPKFRFGGITLRLDTKTNTATAGAVQAVPATVLGYLTIQVDGTTGKIPYFAN